MLTNTQKRWLAAAVITSGAAGVQALRASLRKTVAEQQMLCQSALLDEGNKRANRSPKVAVDAVFAKRLSKILKICVPSPWCYEAGLIYTQTALLVARTFLTDASSQIEGGVGRWVCVCIIHVACMLLSLPCIVTCGTWLHAGTSSPVTSLGCSA